MIHPGPIPDCRGPFVVPWAHRARANHLHLESLYHALPIPLCDGPPAHAVALLIDGWLGQEAVRGRLIADPNVYRLNDFGDRSGGARVTPRVYDVALARLRAVDPEAQGRTLFAIVGAGLPESLTLVMYPYGDRVYLKRDDSIIPLYFNDGPPPLVARASIDRPLHGE